jgi:phage shock protein C
MNEKKLERSQNDQMWCGVAGGIAEYLNIDPVFVRLFFVLTTILGHGFGVLLYFILCILMPENETSEKFETA